MSAHLIQDLPFGEKTLKLSSNAKIKVRNVVRSLIPEQIVLQYLGYCRDMGFHASKLQNDMKSSQCMFHFHDDIPTGLACLAAAVKAFKSGCLQKSNKSWPQLKNRFCSNFVQM